MGLFAMLAFGALRAVAGAAAARLARWVLQLIAVVIAVPIGALAAYWVTIGGDSAFSAEPGAAERLLSLTMLVGILFAPWIALGALVRQKEALARDQALAFELERSELEREALDARLRLLQAQVAPHFLFNTLANVRALVDTGSPQASARARQPDRLPARGGAAPATSRRPRSTQELRAGPRLPRADAHAHARPPAVRAPGRADGAALRCPPMTLLTLVENAVRHGIDPSEEGGRIDIACALRGDRCLVRVSDTGVGLQRAGQRPRHRPRRRCASGCSSSSAAMRELRLVAREPHGVCAELDFPRRNDAAAPADR